MPDTRLTAFWNRPPISGVVWDHALMDTVASNSNLIKALYEYRIIDLGNAYLNGSPLFSDAASSIYAGTAQHLSGHPGLDVWQQSFLSRYDTDFNDAVLEFRNAGLTEIQARYQAALQLAPEMRGMIEWFRAGTQPLFDVDGNFLDPKNGSIISPFEARERGLFFPRFNDDPILQHYFGLSGSGALDKYYNGGFTIDGQRVGWIRRLRRNPPISKRGPQVGMAWRIPPIRRKRCRWIRVMISRRVRCA